MQPCMQLHMLKICISIGSLDRRNQIEDSTYDTKDIGELYVIFIFT